MPHRAMFDDGFSNSFLDADVIKAHTNHLIDAELDVNDTSDILNMDDLNHAHAQGSLSPQDHSFLSALSTGRNSLSGSAHSPSGNSFSSLSPSTAWSALMPLQPNNAGQVGGGNTNQGPMLGGGDEWALGDTFDQGELDMLFFNDTGKSAGDAGGTINMDWLMQLPAQGQQASSQMQGQTQGQGQDNTFDMLNLPLSPTAMPQVPSQQQQPNSMLSLDQLQMQNQNQPLTQNVPSSQNGFTMGQLDLGGMAGAAAWAQIQAEQMRQAQQLREIQRQQQMQFLEAQMNGAAAVLGNVQAQGSGHGQVGSSPGSGIAGTAVGAVGGWTGDANAVAGPSTSANTRAEAVGMQKEPSLDVPKETKKRGRPGRKPKQPSPDSPIPEPGPMGGKHNKTERRYRQKVQAAQADLRDAVPALRVLYGTSTPEQLATTDIKLADGSVDGLPEVSRPNASAKATILSGARQYIELLQDRSASLARKVEELEAYRLAVGGSADLERWRADFGAREQVKQAQVAQSRSLIRMDDDDEGGESEEEEDKQSKKRKKPASASDGAAARVFAAFAMSFSLVPSASTLLSHHPDIDITPGRVLAGSATPTQVIARLPLITAEHVHALIKRMIPLPIAQALVPSPGAMVDWTWRILVAVILLLVLGPIFQKWIGRQSDCPRGAGNVVQMVKDAAGVHDDDRKQWDEYAGAIAGRDISPSRLTRFHVLLRMHKTADSAYSAALLALLQPRLPLAPSPERIWRFAKSRLTPSDPIALHSVLQLPCEEARSALSLVPPTRTPMTAIAEQVALVHLSDLYSAYFVQLVRLTTASPTMAAMSASLDTTSEGSTGKETIAMEQELRHILQSCARGTVAHALALVLVGITNLTSHRSSASAQAALASSLAGEEMRGAPSSVRAMLELLYPGFAASEHACVVGSTTALALDSVANACIAYIGLLVRYRALCGAGDKSKGSEMSRKERQEVSKYVAKAAGQIRVLLSKARCVTGNGDGYKGETEEGGEFEDAKETLVEALAVVGRRASSRAMGRDEDSGLEGDLEEL